MNNYYKHCIATVYGKKNLTDAKMLKNLYMQGVTRIKLCRGSWYDLYYSYNAGYHVIVSMVQDDISLDNRYDVSYI